MLSCETNGQRTPGLMLLALLLSLPSSLAATGNLLWNPNADYGDGTTGTDSVPVPFWHTDGVMTAVMYGSPQGFPGPEISAAIKGGSNFFSGGTGANTFMYQDVARNSAAWAKSIDTGKLVVTVSGWLGGYSDYADSMKVSVQYLNGAKRFKATGPVIGPVFPAARKMQTGFVFRTSSGRIPKGTRFIRVFVKCFRTSPSYCNGFLDNLSLTIK